MNRIKFGKVYNTLPKPPPDLLGTSQRAVVWPPSVSFLTGVTLIELIVAIVIVGVLATLGIAHYNSYQEKTYDSEAQANLRLIAAAEEIYRMEGHNRYLDSKWGLLGAGQPEETIHINDELRLLLNEGGNRVWDYSTTVRNTVNPPPKFCVQATRNVTGGGGRTYKFVRPDDAEPVEGAVCPDPP